MKGSPPNKPQPQPDLANLDESELASNQQVTAVPWFVGQRKFAVTWITPVLNPFSKNAPTEGKK